MLRTERDSRLMPMGIVRSAPRCRLGRIVAGHLTAITTGLVAAGLLALPLAAVAQPSSVAATVIPERGSRVRLVIPSQEKTGRRQITGTLVQLRRDSVRVRTEDGETTIVALDAMESIDVSRGRRHHALAAVGAGTLIGTGFGALVGFLSHSDGCASGGGYCSSAPRSEDALYGSILGGLGGMIVGALFGLTHTTDRWERIPAAGLSRRLSLAPRSTNGIGLVIGVPF